MPVEVDGKTFDNHDAAVSHLKKSKPGIKDPDAYVATIERKQKGGQLKARLQKITSKDTTIDFPPVSRYYECGTCGDSFDTRDEFNQHKEKYPGKHDSPNSKGAKIKKDKRMATRSTSAYGQLKERIAAMLDSPYKCKFCNFTTKDSEKAVSHALEKGH